MNETPRSNNRSAGAIDAEGRLKNVIAETFGLRLEEVDEGTTATTVRAWDSIGQLELVTELELEFEVSFTPEDIMVMDGFRAIYSLLRKKGVT